MKAMLAALVLLFQLQPLVGTVACVARSDEAAQHECKMPAHGHALTTQVTSSGAAAQSCALASICTPARPAVPGLASRWETTVPLLAFTGRLDHTVLVGIPASPPFHPPRA
jgi:hypothetical protein